MASGNDPARDSSWNVPAWMVTGAWAGLFLALGRAAVIWAMEVLGHGGDTTLVWSRVASSLSAILFLAFLAAWVGAFALAGLRERRGPRLVALLFVAGAFACVLLGWWGGDPSLRVELKTVPGVLAASLVALGALVLALLTGTAYRPPGSVWLPLGLAVLGALTFRLATPAVEERLMLPRVARELFADGGWEVLEARDDDPPHAAVLCPSSLPALDGADLQGLALPPPARVRFRLDEDAAGGWLRARAGIDRGAWRQFGDELDGLTVEFRVTLDGRVAFETGVPLAEEMQWREVGDEGLSLAGVGELELSTRLVNRSGIAVEPPGAIAAGFGGLAIEERRYLRRARSSTTAPNIVLIVMDTQRADRTSAYGYERDTTPNLRALAERGLAFDEAYATSSWTWPSTASILTGLHPQEHGVTDKRSCFLPHALETLPEALQRAGFSTAAWSANPLINADKNFDQGFELFDATNEGGMRRSDALVPAALDWLGLMEEWRFFLYLHLVDPHAPLSPLPQARERFAPDVPTDFDPRAITEYGAQLLKGTGQAPPDHQRWISDLYDACTWSGDYWVGRVLERLEELGLTEKTIVVVTSDHGEELFDHGFATHGHSLYRELTRVPLVLAGPGLPAGQRADVPVSNRHLAPTLARLGGATLDAGGTANDLLQVVPAPVFFSTTAGWWRGRHPQTLLGLREGSRVVHFAPEDDGAARLYDLETDPGERRDLAAEHADEAEGLRARAEELARELEERRRSPRIEAGEATLERLRRLGYVGGQR